MLGTFTPCVRSRWTPSTLGVNNLVGHSERWEEFWRDDILYISWNFVVELRWLQLLHISQVIEVEGNLEVSITYCDLWRQDDARRLGSSKNV